MNKLRDSSNWGAMNPQVTWAWRALRKVISEDPWSPSTCLFPQALSWSREHAIGTQQIINHLCSAFSWDNSTAGRILPHFPNLTLHKTTFGGNKNSFFFFLASGASFWESMPGEVWSPLHLPPSQLTQKTLRMLVLHTPRQSLDYQAANAQMPVLGQEKITVN